MSRDCVGFGMCESCYHSLKVSNEHGEFYLCGVNDSIQYRCADCNKRSTAKFNDPRLNVHKCRECFQKEGKQ